MPVSVCEIKSHFQHEENIDLETEFKKKVTAVSKKNVILATPSLLVDFESSLSVVLRYIYAT